LHIAVLTVSDSRGADQDSSGKYRKEAATAAGHQVLAKEIVRDDGYHLRAALSRWIADSKIKVILRSGGTGITGRDSTPEALLPLLDQVSEGLGEIFRQISFKDIGTSTVQSRAIDGLANGTFIFCLPGSRRPGNQCLDVPGWDNSARDGYACCHADLAA